MELVNTVITVCWAFGILVRGFAIPRLEAAATEGGIMSPNAQVFYYLSHQFGYQLAGIGDWDGGLLFSCGALAAAEPDKWAEIGLTPSIVEGPLCNLTSAVANTTFATINSIYYNSKIFTTQLLNSFNSTDRLNELCDSLNIDLLDQFPLIGMEVKSAVCNASNRKLAPQPENTPPFGNTAAVQAAMNTASDIFAILLAAGSTTGSELSVLCAHVPDYMSSIRGIELNCTAVENALCTITKPIPAGVVKATLQTFMSRYYATILESVSKMKNWLNWLCDNVDVAKMNAAGMDGLAVQSYMCRTPAGGYSS